MPHLSPMSWILMPIIILFIILLTLSSTWWTMWPKFNKHQSFTSTPFNSWKW